MVISLFLFIFLIFFLNESLFSKFFIALLMTLYQLSLTAFICKIIGLKNLYDNLLSFEFRNLSWEVYIVSSLTMIFIILLAYFMKHLKISYHLPDSILSAKTFFLLFFSGILILIGTLSFYSAMWVRNFFGNVGLEEMLYTLSQPIEGSDKGQIYTFILGPLLNSVFLTLTVLITFLFLDIFIVSKKRMQSYKLKSIGSKLLTSFSLLVLGVALGIHEIGYAEIKAYFFEKSTLYDEYFVDPNDVSITFPEQKRNLIYIFSESLESTYSSVDLGGAQADNLLPNLTDIALNEGVNFSNTDLVGGALQMPGVGFTVGGMVAQHAGLPLKVVGDYSATDDYAKVSNFMPGATSLGDILEREGYKQTLLIGSEASFGGRDKFYLQHGNYEIRDYNYAKSVGWIPEDYRVWWGYEDEKLFGFAKETLTELASNEEPFNFTMLTADTHFPDGYITDRTPVIYDNQYSNVIHFSDQMLGEFIRWIQQQPFYENTTIVLSGDHLSMDQNFFTSLDESYDRTVFNLVLNSPVEPVETKNRLFSTMDMFPTTLASLGVNIDGERLGLGTNLFSNRKTLMEELGFEKLFSELSKSSTFYKDKIMRGSDLEIHEYIEE